MKLSKWIFIWILLSQLSACGTVVSLGSGEYDVYAGVSRDFEVIKEGGILSIAAVIDLPLSFVLDTLLLPITITY